jgi:hypothetical protein
LPIRIDDIAYSPICSCGGMTKIFAELRNSDDRPSCLVFEADKKNNPDCIYAPKASPRVLAERSKFANFMVFLVDKVTKPACFSRIQVHRHVLIDFNAVRLFISGDGHSDGRDRCFSSGLRDVCRR